MARVAWLAMRWRYSKSSTLSPSIKFAISQNQVIGILRADICWGVTLYVVPMGTVAAKFRIPKPADLGCAFRFFSVPDWPHFSESSDFRGFLQIPRNMRRILIIPGQD